METDRELNRWRVELRLDMDISRISLWLLAFLVEEVYCSYEP